MSDKENRAEDQARAQVASICEMVAALHCDYDRIEELREECEEPHADDCAQRLHSAAECTCGKSEKCAELVELEEAAGECSDADDARQRIEEDALSVEVRSDWCAPGEQMTAGEFRILLCTGGPHVELIGDLDQYQQPDRVRVLYKDWGESGELFDFDRETVLEYCRVFYFGE